MRFTTNVPFLLAFAYLSGCGGERETQVSLSLPFAVPQGLECGAEHQTIGQRMRAVLSVGGNLDCELRVDPDTLEVSGTCAGVVPTTVRPLLLSYSMSDSAISPTVFAPLAYRIGFVDLCDDSLTSGTNVNVHFDGGPNEALVYLPGDFDALPDGRNPPSCSQGLDEAKMWAKSFIIERGDNLDRDCDDSANLVEACGGTLFAAGPTCN